MLSEMRCLCCLSLGLASESLQMGTPLRGKAEEIQMRFLVII